MRDRAKEFYANTKKDPNNLSTGSKETLTAEMSYSMRILDLEDALIELAAKYEKLAPTDAATCSFVQETKNIKKWRDKEAKEEAEWEAEDDEDENN